MKSVIIKSVSIRPETVLRIKDLMSKTGNRSFSEVVERLLIIALNDEASKQKML